MEGTAKIMGIMDDSYIKFGLYINIIQIFIFLIIIIFTLMKNFKKIDFLLFDFIRQNSNMEYNYCFQLFNLHTKELNNKNN